MKAIQTLSLATLLVAVLATASFAQEKESKDWPMWGGTPGRNMVSDAKNVSLDFDLKTGKNVLWQKGLGSQTYGNPIVSDGKVYVGTNNVGGYRQACCRTSSGLVAAGDLLGSSDRRRPHVGCYQSLRVDVP